MQTLLLLWLLLLLLLHPPITLTRGEAWPEVKGWGHSSLGEMLGEIRGEGQAIGSKGTRKGDGSVPSNGDTCRQL